MSKIYTKTGDKGTTGLLDGSRVSKSSIYTETLGSADELTSRIGLLCATLEDYPLDFLREIQGNLQRINSYIASPNKKAEFLADLTDIDKILEVEIDRLEKDLPKLTKFILPGVTVADAHAHSCRTQARCTERQVRAYADAIRGTYDDKVVEDKGSLPEVIFRYLNRLSDYFFVLARWICYISGNEDCFM